MKAAHGRSVFMILSNGGGPSVSMDDQTLKDEPLEQPVDDAEELTDAATNLNHGTAGEAVQAPQLRDQLRAGTNPQVVRVAEDDLGAQFLQFARRHGLDRGLGAHRHEYRRLHRAVRSPQYAAPGGSLGILAEKLETHRPRFTLWGAAPHGC